MDLFGQPERVPVPLTLDDFNEQKLTYTIEMRLPLQVLLNPDFEAMVHDECLWNAHRRGLIPIGQVLVTSHAEDKTRTKPVEELTEGEAMPIDTSLVSKAEQAMRDRVKGNHAITGAMLGIDVGATASSPVQDTVLVRAEVLIGSSL